MEAIGAAASVMAIVEIVGRVSASAASFMRDFKDAREDMIEVRKDMANLSRVLRMIVKCLDHPGQGYSSYQPNDAAHSQELIVDLAFECREIVLDIESVLRDVRSRGDWAMSGNKKVEELATKLEKHVSTLRLALSCHNAVVCHGMEENYARIKDELYALRRDMDRSRNVDNTERQVTEGQESSNDTTSPGGVMLDRLIDGNVQNILDNIEDQQGQDQEDDDEDDDVGEYQQDEDEYEYEGDDEDLDEDDDDDDDDADDEDEDLEEDLQEDEDENLEEDEDEDVDLEDVRPQPGLSAGLHLWKGQFLKFDDGFGKEFDIPWIWVETWEGFNDWLDRNLLDHEVIGPALQQGHYRLIGPDHTYIHRTAGEQLVKPGMSITLSLRPMDQAGQRKERRKKSQSSSAINREQLPWLFRFVSYS